MLKWDSEFFGIRIARLADRRLTDVALRRAHQWCAQQAIRCLYVLVDPDHDETVQLAERHGLHFVDIRVSLARRISGQDPSPHAAHPVRPWSPEDLPGLTELATTLFHGTRFQVDPHFPARRAVALYAEWLRKSCQAEKGTVLVVGPQGRAAGFITCDPVFRGEGRIGLCGVHEAGRNQGVGAALVQAAIRWYAERGAHSIEVVTQGRNVPAQQLYQRGGFLTRTVELWYHWWFHRERGTEL